VCGIIEAPVVSIQLPGKRRTCLIRVAANGDHRIDLSIEKFAEVFRAMLRDVDAKLIHHFDREWMNITGGLRSSAGDLDYVASRRA